MSSSFACRAISAWNQIEPITIGTFLFGVGSMVTGWRYCKGFMLKKRLDPCSWFYAFYLFTLMWTIRTFYNFCVFTTNFNSSKQFPTTVYMSRSSPLHTNYKWMTKFGIVLWTTCMTFISSYEDALLKVQWHKTYNLYKCLLHICCMDFRFYYVSLWRLKLSTK